MDCGHVVTPSLVVACSPTFGFACFSKREREREKDRGSFEGHLHGDGKRKRIKLHHLGSPRDFFLRPKHIDGYTRNCTRAHILLMRDWHKVSQASHPSVSIRVHSSSCCTHTRTAARSLNARTCPNSLQCTHCGEGMKEIERRENAIHTGHCYPR